MCTSAGPQLQNNSLIYPGDIWLQTSESPAQEPTEPLNIHHRISAKICGGRPGEGPGGVGELLPPPAAAAHWLVDVDLQRRLPVCLRLGCICPDRTFVKHNDRSFKAGLSRRPAKA